MSNTDRYPCFRGSASMCGGRLPWPSVVHMSFPDLTPRRCTPPTSHTCKNEGALRWDGPPSLLAMRPQQPSHALRPVTTGNALSAMYYRNCWHIFSPRLLPGREGFDLEPSGELRPRENASSNFRSLTNIPHCCRRRGCFKPRVAGRPLSPAKDRRPETRS